MDQGVALAQVTLVRLSGRAGSLFQGTVASDPIGGRDKSVKHVVAFAGDRTDRAGEMSMMHKRLLVPTDFATRLSIDSFRFVLASFFGDFDADHVLSAR
jgi:hypothetical protein